MERKPFSQNTEQIQTKYIPPVLLGWRVVVVVVVVENGKMGVVIFGKAGLSQMVGDNFILRTCIIIHSYILQYYIHLTVFQNNEC